LIFQTVSVMLGVTMGLTYFTSKRELSVPKVRKGLRIRAVRSDGAYLITICPAATNRLDPNGPCGSHPCEDWVRATQVLRFDPSFHPKPERGRTVVPAFNPSTRLNPSGDLYLMPSQIRVCEV
jgi:hypothetical protein